MQLPVNVNTIAESFLVIVWVIVSKVIYEVFVLIKRKIICSSIIFHNFLSIIHNFLSIMIMDMAMVVNYILHKLIIMWL